MILQPAIIALLLCAALGFAALALSSPASWQLVRHWQPQSGSRLQLALERRTYLMSVLVRFVLVSQIAALLLFVYNAERMAVQFVGAMCAVGTLQANAWGFPALLAQIALFFAASSWLLLDHADRQARDYPLVRLKFAALLVLLLPLTGTVLALQGLYFGNLRADVITSCCGSLFSADSPSVSGTLAALPPRPAMLAFYLSVLLACAANLHYRLRLRGAWLAGASSALAFVAAIVGIIAFVSLYIYEHPHHHCPFCILQAEHGYYGYALYLPLFAASACGVGVGVLAPFSARPGLRAVMPALCARLAGWAAAGFALFLVLATLMIQSSNLILLES